MSEHGTEYTYKRDGCRCNECVEAARAARRRRYAKAKGSIPDDRHGTMTGYSYWSCRCGECVRVWKSYHSAYMTEYRKVHRERLSQQHKDYRVSVKAKAEAKEYARRIKMQQAS